MKLTKISLKLDIKEGQDFTLQKASLMHGILMEWIRPAYAEKLHASTLNPYSQYLEKEQGEWYWRIQTFEDEACREICPAVLEKSQNGIYLRHSRQKIDIIEEREETTDTKELMERFCFQDSFRQIRIRFKTPTAFKSDGRYLFYPDVGCIVKSMINKYDAVTSRDGKIDDQILEELMKNIRILQYRLRSCSFHLEGVRIPAFTGEVRFGFGGSQTLVNYLHFLFHFAEYSGIGIKSAMGMGAIEIQERAGEKNECKSNSGDYKK